MKKHAADSIHRGENRHCDKDYHEKWNQLTLQDRFIFSKVMQDPENSLPLIQYLFPESEIRIRIVSKYHLTEAEVEEYLKESQG